MFQIGNFVIVGSLPSLSVFTKYVNMFQYLLIQWQKEISGFISLSQPKMDSIHTCAKLRIKYNICNNTAMIIYMGLIYITLTFIIFEFQFSTVSVMGHSFKIPMLWDKRSDLVLWEDLEGAGGDGGGRGDRDGEDM